MTIIHNNEIMHLLKNEKKQNNYTNHNKLIINEILEVKKKISNIIISARTNKKKLKKLYKKDKKIDSDFIKFNKNRDKKVLKIVTTEINNAENNFRKLINKLDNNNDLNLKYKNLALDLEKEKKYIKIKDKEFDILNKKILFYQNESIRLSSKLVSTENLNKITKENLFISENKKNELIRLIVDLNDYLSQNNSVKTNLEKQKNNVANNLKKLKNITDIEKANSVDNLNKLINDIFG